jgi:hypothetical protein
LNQTKVPQSVGIGRASLRFVDVTNDTERFRRGDMPEYAKKAVNVPLDLGDEHQHRAYVIEVALAFDQLSAELKLMYDFCSARDASSRLGSGRRGPYGRHFVSWLFADTVAARQFADTFKGNWVAD